MFKNKKISIALLMVLSAAVQLTPVNLYALDGDGEEDELEAVVPKDDNSAQADSWFSWRNLAAGTAVTSVVAGLTTWAYKSYAGNDSDDESGDEIEDITEAPAADEAVPAAQSGWTRNQKIGAGVAGLAVTGVVAGAGYKYRTDEDFKKSVDDKTGAAWATVKDHKKTAAAAGVAATAVAGGLAYYLTRPSGDESDSEQTPSLSPEAAQAARHASSKPKSMATTAEGRFNELLDTFVATLNPQQREALSDTTEAVRKDRNPMRYFSTEWTLWQDKPGSTTMRKIQHKALNNLVQCFATAFLTSMKIKSNDRKLYVFISSLDLEGNYFRKALFNAVSQYHKNGDLKGFSKTALWLASDKTERSVNLDAFLKAASKNRKNK